MELDKFPIVPLKRIGGASGGGLRVRLDGRNNNRTLDLGALSPGNHALVIGGFNNQKDSSREETNRIYR